MTQQADAKAPARAIARMPRSGIREVMKPRAGLGRGRARGHGLRRLRDLRDDGLAGRVSRREPGGREPGGKVQEPLVACGAAVSQRAAQAALRGPEDAVLSMRDAYRRRRDVAVAAGATFGAAGRGLVRLSLASATDVIEEGIARLATAVEEWSAWRHGSMGG